MIKQASHVIRRTVAMFFAAALGAASAFAPAIAQDSFPNQPIKIVVPYPAGGSSDLIARQFAAQLTKELGQPVIIDNRAGAATNIGAEAVVKARPDGYTLLLAGVGQVLNPVFGPTPSFDLMSSLEPVSLLARISFIVAANPKMPFNSPKELIAAAKAAPGGISVASAQLDLFVELLKNKADINLLHVPYKGGAPATTDALSGQVDMVYALVPVLLPHIQGDKLKPIAVTTAKRISALPNTPAFSELGIDSDIAAWYGLMAPAGTPKVVVNRISLATQKIMKSPEMTQKFRAGGIEPLSSQPEEMQNMLRTEVAYWERVAKALPQLVTK